MQFWCHQRFNWNLWYLNTFNDTHERVRHVTQHFEPFANKFNLIFMEPWGGHSLHILASTWNEKIFFGMLRNNDFLILILNYRHPICINYFLKKIPISWTLYFFGFCLEWNRTNLPSMDLVWEAWQSSKKCFQICIHYYYNLDVKSLEEHWTMISRTWINFHIERVPPSKV